MACRWKNLQEPTIPGPISSATLEGLQPLAEECPRLRFMAIGINAMDVPKSRTPPTEESHFTHRISIHCEFRHSPIDDGHAVAIFLSSIFWDIKTIYGNEGYPYKTNRWNDVQREIRQIRDERILTHGC